MPKIKQIHCCFIVVLAVIFFINPATAENASNRLEDESLIRDTLKKYTMFIDDRRINDWLDLFIKDAVYNVVSQNHVGHEEILKNVLGDPNSESTLVHMAFPAVIEMQSANEALAWSKFIVVRKESEGNFPAQSIKYMGRYHDRLVKSADGRWRFASRQAFVHGHKNKNTYLQPQK